MNKKQLTLAFFLFVITIGKLTAQAKFEWAARYNGPSNLSEYVSAMALDSSGNVYVTGKDSEEPYGFVTVKFNSCGQGVWVYKHFDPNYTTLNNEVKTKWTMLSVPLKSFDFSRKGQICE